MQAHTDAILRQTCGAPIEILSTSAPDHTQRHRERGRGGEVGEGVFPATSSDRTRSRPWLLRLAPEHVVDAAAQKLLSNSSSLHCASTV